MNWASYLYLVPVAIAALVLLALLVWRMPRLVAPSRRPTPDEVAFLLAIMALGLATIYGSFYMGRAIFAYRDVGSDTVEQYVPYYLSLVRQLREGTLGAWNFEYGLGVSFMSYESWTLDPFNLLLVPMVLAFGDSFLGMALLVCQTVKVLLSGLLFDRLLVRFCERPVSRVFGGATYALGGFIMLWGQHYWLGAGYVMVAALLVALEGLAERWSAPRFLAVAVLSAWSVMMSPYLGYMILLFAVLYVMVRLVTMTAGDGRLWRLRLFGRLALPVVCGLLVSGITLVPYATLLLTESSRVSGAASSRAALLAPVPASWVPPVLSRVLANGLLSSGQDIPADVIAPTTQFNVVNVYEFVMVGTGCGTLLLVGQCLHWAFTEATRRQRVGVALALAFVALYCLTFAVPGLFNGLSGVRYRSSFVVAVALCILMSVGADRRVAPGKVAKAPLAVCAALTLAVIAWSLVHTVNGRLDCLAYGLALVAATACLLGLGSDRDEGDAGATGVRPAALLALSLCLFLATNVVDGFFSTNLRTTCGEGNFPMASGSQAYETRAALDWIASQDGDAYRVEKAYGDWTRLDDGLAMGYGSATSYNSTLDADVAEFYQAVWPRMLVGSEAYQEWRADPDHPQLLSLLGVRYVLSREPLAWDWCTLVHQEGGVLVYRLGDEASILSLRHEVAGEDEVSGLGRAQREQVLGTTAVVLDEDGATVDGLRSEVRAATGAGETAEMRRAGRDALEGSVEADSAAMAVLALPYSQAWEVRVDGAPVQTYRCDWGFVGFMVPAGEHSVSVAYRVRNLGVGLACLAAGLALTVGSCVVGTRRRGEPS